MNGARFTIIDLKTNRQFDVEAIGKPRTEFGDSLDNLCNGSIRGKESRITAATHKNVRLTGNPMMAVDEMLKK